MASNHVPSDQVPLQGQSIYTDPSYSNFFPNNVERYGTPSWEAQLHQNAALTLNLALQDIRRVAVTTVAYQFTEEALADLPERVRLPTVAQMEPELVQAT